MKKKLVYVLFACLAMVNMALGQQKESRLTLNPEEPVAGQRLELTYNPGSFICIIFITGRWVMCN